MFYDYNLLSLNYCDINYRCLRCNETEKLAEEAADFR